MRFGKSAVKSPTNERTSHVEAFRPWMLSVRCWLQKRPVWTNDICKHVCIRTCYGIQRALSCSSYAQKRTEIPWKI